MVILHTASNLIEGVLLRFTGGGERKMKVKHPTVQHHSYYFVPSFLCIEALYLILIK